MNYIILTYAIYLVFAGIVTVWFANTFFKNGRIFLIDIFHGNTLLADSVNKLLVVGFYLVNIGYTLVRLQVWDKLDNYQQVIEKLSMKLGAIILILGAMHFFNLYIFFTLRKKAKTQTPPAESKNFLDQVPSY